MLGNLQGYFGPVKLRDITPLKVEEYQRDRIKAVCPATSNREMALLKHMFNMAERWGQHQGSNPVRLVRFLPEDNLRFETLSEEQENMLLSAAPPYFRELVAFAINTGLRTSDILGLQWTEVDLENKRRKRIIKKSEKPLSLPLNDAAFAVIKARLAVQNGSHVFYWPVPQQMSQSPVMQVSVRVKPADSLAAWTLRHLAPRIDPLWIGSGWTAAYFFSEPDAGLIVVEELDSGLLQDTGNFAQRIGARTHRPIESFHSPDGSQGDLCLPRKVTLCPPKESPGRPDMPSR
jgi:Phage integrase family